jgi:hypothetical protein
MSYLYTPGFPGGQLNKKKVHRNTIFRKATPSVVSGYGKRSINLNKVVATFEKHIFLSQTDSSIVNYKKGCTRLASDKIYQLLAHGRWFSPASCTTKIGRHDIAEILLKVYYFPAIMTHFWCIFSFFLILKYLPWNVNQRAVKSFGLSLYRIFKFALHYIGDTCLSDML